MIPKNCTKANAPIFTTQAAIPSFVRTTYSTPSNRSPYRSIFLPFPYAKGLGGDPRSAFFDLPSTGGSGDDRYGLLFN